MKIVINNSRSFGRQYRGHARTTWTSYNLRTEGERNIAVDSPDWDAIVRMAERWCLQHDGATISRELNGSLFVRLGYNTIQLWEQERETRGQDNHYWMVCRGPAFEASGSERLSRDKLKLALAQL